MNADTRSDADVTTVLFDLDDTLCEYRRTTDEVLALAFEAAGADPFFTAADWRSVIPTVTSADTEEEFRRLCFEIIAEGCGYDPAVARAVATAYGNERDHGNVRFLPGAREALDALADEYRVGLVTNGDVGMQTPKLEALALTEAFDHFVFVGDGVPPKPDPTPFHTALDALGATPERTVHVGNSLAADVAGARAAGIRSVWIPDEPDAEPGDHAPDHTLDSLRDLRTVPGIRC